MTKHDHDFETPQPNKADIMAQLAALFPPDFVHPYPDALIEIAYGMPGNISKAQLFSAFQLEAAADFAIARNLRGCNIYVGPTLKGATRRHLHARMTPTFSPAFGHGRTTTRREISKAPALRRWNPTWHPA